MANPKFKEIRLKYLSVSVIVTLLALIILQGLLYLQSEGILDLPYDAINKIGSASLVISVLFFSSLLLRLTMRGMIRLFDEPEERIFYSKIYAWTVYTIAIFIILNHFGVSLGNITLFVGLLATGLAFAIRDVLLSFFGWIILLRKKPFRIGDYIRIGEDEGTVLHIGTFYVLLDKIHEFPEGFTRVPNRLFLEKSITKLGKESYHEQLSFVLSGIPDNRSNLISGLRKDLETLVGENNLISVYTDLKNEKLYMVLEYKVLFTRRQTTRSEVIERVYQQLKGYLALPGMQAGSLMG